MVKKIICILLLLAPTVTLAVELVPTGKRPPPFSLLSLSGGLVNRGYLKDSPGAILFWSTASPESEDLLDDFKKYHERYGEEELKVVAINGESSNLTGEELRSVMSLYREKQLPFPVLLDWNRKIFKRYNVRSLPSTVVIDSYGRTVYTGSGYPGPGRHGLEESLFTIMGRDPESGRLVAVKKRGAPQKEDSSETAVACKIPRAYHCLITAERGTSPSDPSVMAVRLSVCRGDSTEAHKMLRGMSKDKFARNDLRFALGNMMLLKGKTEEARKTFAALHREAPEDGWGAWGLGLAALAEGKPAEAVRFMEEGHSANPHNPEAETAALKFLETYWRADRRGPVEDGFLSLFAELTSVKDCYRKNRGSS